MCVGLELLGIIHECQRGFFRSAGTDRALFGLILCDVTEVSTKVSTRLPASGTGTRRHLHPLTPKDAPCY